LVICVFLFSSCSDRSKTEAVWAGGGRGQGELVYPRAIDYDANADVFVVVDRTARVQRYDHNGKFLNGWRMPDWERGKPVGITVGPDGNYWIADTHYHRVVIYSPQGEKLDSFGERGAGPKQFELPTDIAFLGDFAYISEYGGNDRVQVINWKTKEYQFTFGHFGNGTDEFSRPQSMHFVNGPDGEELYITDSCNHRLQVWSKDGKHLRNIGESGSPLGQFRFPYGLTQDKEGNLIVTEYGNTRVQRLKPDGTPIDSWGKPGRLTGELAYPWDTAVDKDGRCVIIDAGNNRMQVFRF
jgi:DNA-binding beta-propeller fold protein YncE